MKRICFMNLIFVSDCKFLDGSVCFCISVFAVEIFMLLTTQICYLVVVVLLFLRNCLQTGDSSFTNGFLMLL